MEVHIATVGLTKEPIFLGVNVYPIDKLILLCSDDNESRKNSLDIAKTIEKMNIDYEIHEVDAFDLESVLITIMDLHKKHQGNNLSINLTGGTKVMASAALLAGYILGVKVYYIQDGKIPRNKGKGIKELTIELPVPKISIHELEETQRKILSFIHQEHGTIERANSTINESLKISRQNVSYHLKQLAQKELIAIVVDGRNKTVKLTNTGRLFARIFSK